MLILIPTYANAAAPVTPADAFYTMWNASSAASVFNASSYGRVTYPPERAAIVGVTMTTDISADCNADGYTEYMLNNWATLSRSVHHTPSATSLDTNDPSTFGTIVTFVPGASGCTWGGLAYVNGCIYSGNRYCRAWIMYNSARILSHELG